MGLQQSFGRFNRKEIIDSKHIIFFYLFFVVYFFLFKFNLVSMGDIASHIISTKGFQRAESYAEMFEILNKNNIKGENLSTNLVNMARFRNVLVHGYAKIDNSRVILFIKQRLIDVENFIKEILKLIKN